MSKRRLSVFVVGTADWMKYRPYTRFAPEYDAFYLRLANQAFEVVNEEKRVFRSLLHRDQLVELAVVLASWFEDYANEIGLWSTFVRKNKALYGYYLPFFDLREYDPEDMNPEDLAYLLWHYCNKAVHKFIGPDSPGLMECAETLLELMDEALEEAPGTEFYDQYLTISENIYFFDLKRKLHWMAFQNYLLGPEFHRVINEEMKEFQTENSRIFNRNMDPDKIFYTMQDDFHYKRSSSFLACTVPDWFAELARCPEPLREDIRVLFRRIIGEFVYDGDEGKFYLFRHYYTKRLFKVHQESVVMKGIRAGELVFTTLVNWRGDYWVTGTLAGYGDAETARKKEKKEPSSETISFYAWSETQQQTLREMQTEMEAAHLEFFGDRLVFFKNNHDLQAALQQQQEYYNQTKTTQSARTQMGMERKKQLEQQFSIALQDLYQGKGIAIFYEPGMGVSISPLVPTLSSLLSQKDVSSEHKAQLFFTLFKECSPALIHYLLEKYGSGNLQMPVNTAVPLSRYMDFFMRFFNPGAFREVLPNSSLFLED